MQVVEFNEKQRFPESGRKLVALLKERMVILDGAMGTMIQQLKFEESDYRGSRFQGLQKDQKGNNELLTLSQPGAIREIHKKYLLAGADIIETNTFSANRISMLDFGTEHLVAEINEVAARLAVEACAEVRKQFPQRSMFVAGSIGPTNRTASLSPDVSHPNRRNVTFDELRSSYKEQTLALVKGGVDLLLPETTFDTLNLKAAIFAIEEVFAELGYRLPVILSVTITDLSGRTLSGQTLEAFWWSVRHARPLAVGINCALGAKEMRPYVEQLSRIADCYTACYPNAGLPNPLSDTGYDEKPADTAAFLKDFVDSGLVNIVGGCCGTTPDHIRAVADAVRGLPRRMPPTLNQATRLAGLEPLISSTQPGSPFLLIGERTNVTGSPKFAQMVREGRLADAMEVARSQVSNGANILDVNFDEGMLNSEEWMKDFLNLLATEPEIARVPIMVDSSKWSVIEAGLKCVQGKAVVNSLSLKEGEGPFRQQATLARNLGAAVVVMAFDEQGQATSTEEKVRICKRAYDILVNDIEFDPTDIIFDANILTVATGIEEHNPYGVNFIEAVRELKTVCPGARTSGGVSNISFSFRGNQTVREAMHSAFLFHAIQAGLDMAIVNAGLIEVYEQIPENVKTAVEDVLLNRRIDATERLLEVADQVKGQDKGVRNVRDLSWREGTVEARMSHALVNGIDVFVEEDTKEALEKYKVPLNVIEGPLMEGMKIVGELFGQGKMFLPQVVKSARVMKKSVAWLEPMMAAEKARGQAKQQGKIVLATVKGDVHDIGKNIVGVVLACNGYEVIDMGVMVSADKILSKARQENADYIGLSGLITPSLEEMAHVAKEMERQKFQVPLLIGGATTSKLHTAIKLDPHYSGTVVHVADASLVVGVCSNLNTAEKASAFKISVKKNYHEMRHQYLSTQSERAKEYLPIGEARARKFSPDWSSVALDTPSQLGVRTVTDLRVEHISPYIDWSPLFWAWEIKGVFPTIFDHPKFGTQAKELYAEAQKLLERIAREKVFSPKAVFGLWPAHSEGDDVILFDPQNPEREIERIHFLRQQMVKQGSEANLCLADFVAPVSSGKKDYLGAFAVTMGNGVEKFSQSFIENNDDFASIMVKAIGDRLAEAFTEKLHSDVRRIWGFGNQEHFSNAELIAEKYRGIRPAPGYPACPDHTEKAAIWKLLNVENAIGLSLTENFAMTPTSSVSGFYFAHPGSKYFTVGAIMKDQVEDYARRKGMTVAEAEKWLAPNLAY